MNIKNQININQTINLDELGLVPCEEVVSRQELGRFYDDFEEQIHCFAAVTDLLANCSAKEINAERMYRLWSKQEDLFRELLLRLDDMMTA